MWRNDSFFGDGPRHPRSRDELARFRWVIRQNRIRNKLSPGHADVLEALAATLGGDGRLDPSHAFLAARAGVSVSTVQRALDRARELGMIGWQRRLVRRAWRTEQATNAYWLCCDCQPAPADKIISCVKRRIEVVPAVSWEIVEARIALAAAEATSPARIQACWRPNGRPGA